MSAHRDEILYENEATRIIRRHLPDDGGSVILKETLGSDAAMRLRHEAGVLQRLSGVEGVPRLISLSDSSHAMALHDGGGVSLAAAMPDLGRLGTPELLEFALRLTGILAAVHAAGVVHKDINPANILLAGPERRPELIDFDLATAFTEERPAFVHHDEIAGTLAYIAPEQTGRMGRSVDQRADLYSLGVTLYELAAGQPPFVEDDPLQLIHDHLACVPAPPIALAPDMPEGLSRIIMRLLEKEPDRRYQSAEGLARDLGRLREALSLGLPGDLPLGERDFPLRLSPPSRLIGRQGEIDALREAFEDAVRGRERCVLVTGAPGVGKTALINELRPIVTARRGWFVTGKYDQYRRDAASGAVVQALRGLGRLLLAEPEAEIAAHRERILAAIGTNAGLIPAMSPEFAVLLDCSPEAASGDPVEAETRLRVAVLDLLRAVASPSQPFVMVLDDLQWASSPALRLIDALLTEGGIPGLLLVGAYREAELDMTHPMSAMLRRWAELDAPPQCLRLRNLPSSDIGVLIQEMLRLAPAEAAKLAAALGARTGGNPYDTVELINALRQDGVLTPGEEGWTWDETAIRRHIGGGDVVDLLSLRISRLPSESREILAIMARLGSDVEFSLLEAATGLDAAALEENLAPPLEDGLLAMEHAGAAQGANRENAVRFRHDRVQQAAHDSLTPEARRGLCLAIARRLAERPAYVSEAAAQYLGAADAITDGEERRRVIGLFREAAANAYLVANYTTAERFLSASLRLLSAVQTDEDASLFAALEIDLHKALYSLGRFEEADAVYRSIEGRSVDVVELAEAAWVQVSSLTNRSRPGEAIALGLDLLQQLGLTVPRGADLGAAIDQGLNALYHWIDNSSQEDDLLRPETDDPSVRAAAKIMNRLMPPAFFCDHTVFAWLVIECRRLWAEYGPSAPMVGVLSHIAFVTIALREDYHIGYRAVRRVLETSEARGYEPETSQARFLYALGSTCWFEPLEECILQGRRAYEGLLHGGDLQNAGFTCYATILPSLDSALALDNFLTEVDSALSFAERTGNHQCATTFLAYRQLVRFLRGETSAPDSFTDATFDETAYEAGMADNTSASVNYRIVRALAAALFGKTADLERHAAAAMALLPHVSGTFATLPAHILQCLALAGRIRTAEPDERPALLEEFDACHNWLALRAADAPSNFLYLLWFVEAERTWAVGDFQAAISAFDTALYEVQMRQRPWQCALITERAALFHLSHGLEHIGRQLMAEARKLYEVWGAAAKVAQLSRSHAFLNAVPVPRRNGERRRSSVSSDSIDLLAILRASQALSSETSLEKLRLRIAEQLKAMTGATMVSVVLWYDEAREWRLLPTADEASSAIPVEEAGALGMLSLSAFRYAERNREPLLVEDATRDDRFARDPYFAQLDQCSLLVVPVLSQGAPRALLLLENRLSRGAFSPSRLDAVMLIAGQLAVSLDNALLYGSLERKVADRTEALAAANLRLESLSITDPLTGLANRRRFDEVFEAEWLRSLRTVCPIAAAMVDIDHFKLYNDRYGHLAGDACLQSVAATLKESVRQDVDLVARYGGEEFAIILPGTGLEAAASIVERARAAVAALREPHEGSSHGIVTVSIGIAAVVPQEVSGSELLLTQADGALYNAKRGGRNRVSSTPDAAA